MDGAQRAAVAFIGAALSRMTDRDGIRRLMDGARFRFTAKLGRQAVEVYDYARDVYVTGRGESDRYLLFDYGTWEYVDLERSGSGFLGMDHRTGERFTLTLEPGRAVLVELGSGARSEFGLQPCD